MSADHKQASEFDENRATQAMDAMSRVIAAIGVDTMRNLVTLRVLIVGLRGVGVETAKNIILGRVEAVTVHDPNLVAVADLGTNFYLNPSHVGKVSRADACVKSLAELNPYVHVDVHNGALDDKFIESFGAVIICDDLPKKELIRINNVCHKRNPSIAFILATTHGVTGTFFTDFGPNHVVTDHDGEAKKSVVIERLDHVTGRVKCAKAHGFDDGDWVNFEDVRGVDEKSEYILNRLDKVKVKRIYTTVKETDKKTGKEKTRSIQVFDTFQIDLESVNEALARLSQAPLAKLEQLGEYKEGGIVNEVKPRIELKFRPLEESLVNPCVSEQDKQFGVFHPDQERWMPEMLGGKQMGSQLHLAYLATLDFQEKHGRLPRLHNQADAKETLAIAEQILTAHKALPAGSALVVEKLKPEVVLNFSLFAAAELPGYAAFLGGIAAQEVVKKFGKYSPHFQWMQSDHLELLGQSGEQVATLIDGKAEDLVQDRAPQGSRYDHQISIFGQKVQEKISNQRWFLVGCGALGCEYLKGFALMGIGCGKDGQVYVTDMDRIELSNLSRQFLFRNRHIGKPKSVCGAEVAVTMNPDMKIKTFETKVAPETENIFNDAFWDSLTGVWNALDNVHARRYSDSKCLLHGKPLMESGTMGTSANSEVILPHMTRTYNDTKDQEVGGIAACTLRNFPHLIEHCIEWARPEFQELFELAPQNVNKFLQNRDAFFAQIKKEGHSGIETLQKIKNLLEKSKNRTYENCVQLAFDHFNVQFRNRILDLIHFFPKDTRVIEKETGADLGPFWTGSKRFPQAADFTVNDELHLAHLFNTANLFAFMFKLEPVRDLASFKKLVEGYNLKTPTWEKPSKGPNMEGDDTATSSSAGKPSEQKDDDELLNELVTAFKAFDLANYQPLQVAEFEKDDDSNFHIDFITSTSNLRAWNYHIQQASRHKCKIIAGKIIPALATTTAMITGLVELEYYKFVMGMKLNAFFNSNPNLALGKYNLFNPMPPIAAQERKVTDESTMTESHIKPFPNNFSSWDYVVVDKGDITVEEFVKLFPSIHLGVEVVMLFKAGITQQDVESGKVQALYNKSGLRSTAMQEQMLKRSGLSDAIRARFQKEIDDINAYNETVKTKLHKKLSDLYVEIHGPFPAPDRNYILLTGEFHAAGCDVAEIPLIKFIFKH